jgi:peptidoglycan/xylan/chitin deacetylase (PgdA/CDA1 family)
MAVFRARAVAVAAGVPAIFAFLAAVLAVATPATIATAAEPAPAPAAQPAAATESPFGTTRPYARGDYRPLPVTYRLATADKVAFITIDDGVDKNAAGLRYVEKNQIPITAFLTTWTIKDRARYFERLTEWGSIQNHSATHSSYARSTTDLNHEICYSQKALGKSFGSRAWMMRPPYGQGSDRLEAFVTARRCGISEVVMWDAVVDKGKVSLAGGKLTPGAIVLLHFTPNLEGDLKAAVRAIRKAGLTPANLADYLPAPATT